MRNIINDTTIPRESCQQNSGCRKLTLQDIEPYNHVSSIKTFQDRQKQGYMNWADLQNERNPETMEVRIPQSAFHNPVIRASFLYAFYYKAMKNERCLISTSINSTPVSPWTSVYHSPLLHEFPDRGDCGARSQVSIIWTFIFLHYLFCRNTKSKHFWNIN